MAEALFYAFGLTALYGGGNVIARRHPLVCAVHLALALFALSGVYLLLGFPLLAGLNLLIYAGAILVLFLFVIMLLDLRALPRHPLDARVRLGVPLVLVLFLETLALAVGGGEGRAPREFHETAKATGAVLFGKFLLPFEAAGLLLVIGIVAALVLARRPSAPAGSPPKVEVPPPFRVPGFPEGRA